MTGIVGGLLKQTILNCFTICYKRSCKRHLSLGTDNGQARRTRAFGLGDFNDCELLYEESCTLMSSFRNAPSCPINTRIPFLVVIVDIASAAAEDLRLVVADSMGIHQFLVSPPLM